MKSQQAKKEATTAHQLHRHIIKAIKLKAEWERDDTNPDNIMLWAATFWGLRVRGDYNLFRL